MSKSILIIDPGHGGKDPGGGTNEYWNEKDFVLKISLYQYERFKKLGVNVLLTRKEDITLSSTQRSNIVKESGAKYCISNHINAGGGEGAEVIKSIYNNGELANNILDEIVKEGMKKRRIFSKALPKDPKKDYYYMHRLTGSVATLIIEYGFADNINDTNKLKDNWKKYAEAVVRAYCVYLGIPYSKDENVDVTKKIKIMGDATATRAQMKKYLLSSNPNPKINCSVDELVDYYIQEGQIEGVRGDIAFAQALKETGFFKFGGIVLPEQNNFAGLGALNNNQKGQAVTFSTPQIGVRAQIQHLKGYASKEPLKKEIVDPRYKILVDKKLLGTAPYVTDLNGKWAWPGKTYGQGILKILDKILQVKVDEPKNDCDEIIKKKDEEIKNKEDEIKRLKAENLAIKEKINKIKAILK